MDTDFTKISSNEKRISEIPAITLGWLEAFLLIFIVIALSIISIYSTLNPVDLLEVVGPIFLILAGIVIGNGFRSARAQKSQIENLIAENLDINRQAKEALGELRSREQRK